jgi:hypothetical protein
MSKIKKDKGLLNDSAQSEPELLSADELKLLAATRPELDRSTLPNYDNSDLAVAKRYAKKNKVTVIFVISTIAVLLAIISVLLVFLFQKIAQAPSKNDYVVTIGDDEYTVKYKKAQKDGMLYLDIVKIARYADLIVSGNSDSVKISCADGTYIKFEKGKSSAIVNGDTVKLEGPVYIEPLDKSSDEKIECLVPFSTIEDLFSYQTQEGTVSLYVRLSKNNEILIRRIVYKETQEPLPISFSADCFDLILK